jgi:hypothetical protein
MSKQWRRSASALSAKQSGVDDDLISKIGAHEILRIGPNENRGIMLGNGRFLPVLPTLNACNCLMLVG